MNGKCVVVVLAALGASAITQPVSAQEYPSRPLRMLVAFAPGGNTDILARAVGARMAENWGRPVVVDNRPGGSGMLAAEIVAKAAPDGHTVFVGSTGELSINPSLFRKMPYNVQRDFAPVTLGTVSPLLVVVHPSFPAKTLAELLKIARARPGTLAYASVGIGTPQHLSGELFKMVTGTDIVHVPYKGGAPATTALLGGQEVQFGFVGMGPVIPHVQSGRLRALAISTARRSNLLPEVATLQELGVKDFDTSIWFAFVVPAKTPKGIIGRLNAEIVRILRRPDVRDYLLGTGVEVTPGAPDELARFIKSEGEKYRKIIQVSGSSQN
ncbi:MAG TPA: tripartite tricarboxylate transporter substrate binding protein [Burkholderiales bacterium]|nr:tripartite tricarboxylate transporter substrate binding protein [Burkholderiales bacterium]